MHDDVQYDPIYPRSSHKPLKVGNPLFSKDVFSTIYSGSWNWPRILKL